MKSNIVSMLCYVFGIVSGIIFLCLEPHKNDPEIRFHAWQSIFFGASWFVVSIAITILANILSAFGYLSLPMSVIFLGVWIFLLIRAYQGNRYKLPVIGAYAERFSSK